MTFLLHNYLKYTNERKIYYMSICNAKHKGSCTDTIECYVERALDAIGGKWSFMIIKNLFDGTKRFGELRKDLNNISPRTLTAYLKSLEKQQILTRTVTPTIPPAVHYSLTDKGQALKSIVDEMQAWGKTWVNAELKESI